MANYLSDLALGLRQAAGVLNPQVQQETFAADNQKQQALDQLRAHQFLAQQQFQLQQATPQAALQRQQLENEVGFRKAIQEAGGDPAKIATASMQFGKPEIAMTLYKSQEDRQARLQTAKDNMDMKMLQLANLQNNQAATLAQREQARQDANALKQQSMMLQAQIAQGNQSLKAMGLDIQRQGQEMKLAQFGQQQQQQTQKQTAQLGVALEKANIPQTESVLRGAETALQDKSVIPYIAGPKVAIPDLIAPKNVTDARQAVQKLFNITLKDRSGAAVTNQELERLKSEFGQGLFKKSEQLTQAMKEARRIIEDHYRGIASGYGQQALENYNANLREVGGTPLLEGKRLNNAAPEATTSQPGLPPPPPGFKIIK